MEKQITDKQIKEIAEAFKMTYAHLKTIINVETSGRGFDKEGNMFIQFEPHLFSKWLTKFGIDHQYSKKVENGRNVYYIAANGIEFTNGVEVQSKELKAYEKAKQISEGAAMLSTSWGLGQILGENYAVCGYNTAREMIKAFDESEYFQVYGMAMFLKNNSIINSIVTEDWEEVAKRYNGAGYIYNTPRYDVRLREEYEKLKAVK